MQRRSRSRLVGVGKWDLGNACSNVLSTRRRSWGEGAGRGCDREDLGETIWGRSFDWGNQPRCGCSAGDGPEGCALQRRLKIMLISRIKVARRHAALFCGPVPSGRALTLTASSQKKSTSSWLSLQSIGNRMFALPAETQPSGNLSRL